MPLLAHILKFAAKAAQQHTLVHSICPVNAPQKKLPDQRTPHLKMDSLLFRGAKAVRLRDTADLRKQKGNVAVSQQELVDHDLRDMQQAQRIADLLDRRGCDQ